MCIIIWKPADKDIPEWRLRASMEQNDDGWGLMWHEGGRVHTVKSTVMEDFWKHYDQVKHRSVAIHFRFRTHGNIDNEQAHPYQILDYDKDGMDLWMMHNGIIPIDTPDQTKSDTWTWIHTYVRPLLKSDLGLYYDSEFWKFVKSDIGGSRLMFLDDEGKFRRVGEWHEIDGCLYSNLNPFWWDEDYGGYGYGGWGYTGRRRYRRIQTNTQPRVLALTGPNEAPACDAPAPKSPSMNEVLDDTVVDEKADEGLLRYLDSKKFEDASNAASIWRPTRGDMSEKDAWSVSVVDLANMDFSEVEIFCRNHPDAAANLLWDLIHEV